MFRMPLPREKRGMPVDPFVRDELPIATGAEPCRVNRKSGLDLWQPSREGCSHMDKVYQIFVSSTFDDELAAHAIEKIIDPAAPLEERAQRRRRLTKGPPEFRADRVDLPKAKKG